MYVYLCQMSSYVLLYFVVFDLVSIWYLFSLFLTLYSMYLYILYMSPLYIDMFLYFSISLFYLSYFTWLYCVCPPFLKTVSFLSWITCNVMHVYLVFQTMYLVQVYWNKFCYYSYYCYIYSYHSIEQTVIVHSIQTCVDIKYIFVHK